MNIIGMSNYRPTNTRRNSILGLLDVASASFGMGMSNEWNNANNSDKAKFPDWWKNMVDYKSDTTVDKNSASGSLNSYKVPNQFMDRSKSDQYQVPNQFINSNSSESYKVPNSLMDDGSGVTPHQIPNQFMDDQHGTE